MFSSQKFTPVDIDAIDAILIAWKNRWPQMGVLILLPEAERHCIPALQVLFSKQTIPMFGAVFPALITDNGFVTAGAWLLCFDRMPPSFLISDLDEAGGRKISKAVEKALGKMCIEGVTPTLFMIFDGMIPNVATLLYQLHSALTSRVTYAGVNAGSETFQEMPCLFDGCEAISNGVLALLLPAKSNVVVQHSYPISKQIMTATSGQGNRIDTINNRVAFDAYQEVMNVEYGVILTRENFYEFSVHFPFGLVTTLDVLVRIPVGFDTNGALYCVGEVPNLSLLRLLRAPDTESSSCVREVTERLRLGEKTGNVQDRPLLCFYCAGRRMSFPRFFVCQGAVFMLPVFPDAAC